MNPIIILNFVSIKAHKDKVKYKSNIFYEDSKMGDYGYGYGYGGCGPCGYKKGCCPPSRLPPPQVSGNWNVTLSNLVRDATGPDVTCANVTNVTSTQQIALSLTQCGRPNDAFVTATVTSGPTGTSPIVPGDQLLGIFHKDTRQCYTLKLVSPTDNTTFEMDFLGGRCPRKANISYTKPVDPSSGDFSAVGGGCASRV